jgi:hypothetical protein
VTGVGRVLDVVLTFRGPLLLVAIAVASIVISGSPGALLLLLKFGLALGPMIAWAFIDYADFLREIRADPEPRPAWKRSYTLSQFPYQRRRPPLWYFLCSMLWFFFIFMLPFP